MGTLDIIAIATSVFAVATSVLALLLSYRKHRIEERQIDDLHIHLQARAEAEAERMAAEAQELRLRIEVDRDQSRSDLHETMSRILEHLKTQGPGEITYELATRGHEDVDKAGDSAGHGNAEGSP